MDELEGCFDSLAAAAVTGKDTLDSLVKSNALLAKTNAELSAALKVQGDEIKAMSASLATLKFKKRGGAADGGRSSDSRKRDQKWCPHCKRDTWHDPDDCFELTKNAAKRRPGWKSVFDTS